MFRGKPQILIGSTEHYGAVINLDFDYIKYLDEIASSGLNVTRTFSGIYVEPAGAFGIKKNTLAPAPGRFICPWARSTEPGYANGGNRFNLTKWDKAYFARLKDFISEAGKRNVVVELDLFSNFYQDVQWKLSPLYMSNNVNNIGDIQNQREILSLQHPEIIDVQKKMVRKIIYELKDFDNLYYEICNEPYFGDTLALREWEKYMTSVVIDAESKFKQKHLISNNIANNYLALNEAREGASIYNFHYAKPPVTVPMNYHLNMVIGDNETGFNGIEDKTYRIEAWDFIFAGGGLFNNLDYSFTADNEDGTNIVEKGEPGGGSKILRNQFKILAEFMQGIDFINMSPLSNEMLRLSDPDNTDISALSKDKDFFAVYLHRKDTSNVQSAFEINIPEGTYRQTWVNTRSGDRLIENMAGHPGGWAGITTPHYSDDIALIIEKVSK